MGREGGRDRLRREGGMGWNGCSGRMGREGDRGEGEGGRKGGWV